MPTRVTLTARWLSIARNTDEKLRQLWVTHQPTPTP